MKPMLKPPGTKHLKLKCGVLLSAFAFKFYLRRYIERFRKLLQELIAKPADELVTKR
jgi:hypothetical protein